MLPFIALLAAFLIQLAWPTVFGWRVTFAGWLGFLLLALFLAFLDPVIESSGLWMLGVQFASLMVLYFLRPRVSADGPSAGRVLLRLFP
jgi:hypothetical protein